MPSPPASPASPATSDAAVAARDLRLAYAREVVFSVKHLDIPAGQVTALIGPNGAGKSTLLDAVAGLLRPVAGTLEVLGTGERGHRPRVALVPQSTHLDEALPITVAEVVAMGRYPRRGPFRRFGPSDRAATAHAMERLDVAALSGQRITELSGGQRQRVLVAQGLAQEADLLLLDEPVTGLDLTSRQRILDVLTDARREAQTVVFSTHDLRDAAFADHVLLLRGGVLAEGPPSAVLTEDNLAEAYGGRFLRVGDGFLVDDATHHTHDGPHDH
ncbi:MAG: zinc ABC transporter ATP-binding protein AztA [Acidimicrobiia bacterium]|nr:zinc ABC transporter ATP-binding protein AztA [Acidimicrobiia bacterium]